MKIKSAKPQPKPIPFVMVKNKPEVYALPISVLPPCSLPAIPMGKGVFKLPEGRAHDRTGAVKDRMARMIDYIATMPKHVHPSRPRVEEIVMSWGHPPERADEIYKNLDLSQAPESEGELP